MRDHPAPSALRPWACHTGRGLTLRGYESANRGRPIIHFMHGNGFCGLVYWPLLEPLLEDYDLILTDVQGHGDSDSGNKFLGWNANAEMALASLHHRLLSRNVPVIGMGHSLGAVLTTLMAAKSPKLFSQLLLLDPVYFPKRMLHAMRGLNAFGLLRAFPLPRGARGRTARWSSRRAAHEYLRGRGIFRRLHPDALESYVQYALHREADGQVALKCPNWLEAGFFASYPRGLWPSIAAVSCPTATLVGRQTFPFVRQSAQLLPQVNEHYAVRWLEGGHCFMLDDPSMALTAVREALAAWGDVRQSDPECDSIAG